MSMLALEQAPPISAPFRFFLTAPLYGAAAGVVLALRADTVLSTRWAMDSLALVHLLVLGFMLQVMAGALLQFMPVAAGSPVWRPRLVAGATHVGLNLGTLSLVAGFLSGTRALWSAAAVTLAATLFFFIAAVGVALARSNAIGPTLLALRLAVGSLAVTGAFGFTLSGAMGWGWELPLQALTQVHAAWGLLGWALVLVAGVAGLVVPMFQLTPPYPVRFARAVPLGAVAALLCWSVGVLWNVPALAWAGAVGGAAAVAGFAVQTLRLQARRRRQLVDGTFWAWRVGMGGFLGAAALALWLWAGAPPAWQGRLEFLLGVVLLGGAFPAVVCGMLYKIVPFLAWLHLSRVVPKPPHMHLVIPEPGPKRQLKVLAAAVATLMLGVFWAPLVVVGGLVFAGANLLLLFNLVGAVAVYRRALTGRAA
jgi:hypothetical protein